MFSHGYPETDFLKMILVETLYFWLLLVVYGQIITQSPLPARESRKNRPFIILSVRGATIMYQLAFIKEYKSYSLKELLS